MLKLGLGKYRTIVVLIGMFLVFDVGVLVMTFLISHQIAADAVSLNLAGQQRTLVQQLTKTALLLEEGSTQGTIDSSGKSSFSELRELFATSDALNASLGAFEGGGKMLDSGEEIQLTPQDDVQAAAFYALLKDLWQPINAEVEQLRKQKTVSNADVGSLLQVLVPNNLNLLTVSNMLAGRLESLSAAKASKLRAVQVAGISVALVNFVFILYNFLGQLRRSDQAVERAQKETEDILRTTQEGLFLLDTNFRMGTQTSHALSKILGVENIAGQNFLDLLKPLVTPKTYETAKEYIELLLRHEVKEKLVASLNPLDCIEINATRPSGAVETRYLHIRFNRVLQDGKVTHLLVTANDITKRVRLERELKETERKVQDQMGMMVHILQADQRLLQDFLRSAVDGLDQINEELKASGPNGGMSTRRLELIFRVAHRLKGDATALNLDAIAQTLHSFESALEDLRAQPNRGSEDLLPITVRVKGLYAEVNAIQEVLSRITQVRGVVSVEPPKPAHDPMIASLPFVRQWKTYAHQIAERHGKKIELSYQGLDIEALSPSLSEAINSIANQFIRNAIAHGVEVPSERKRRGKSEAGRISVYVSDQGDGSVELSFRDDGAGIDPVKVRAAAIRAGLMSEEQADKADIRALVATIFEGGVSTRETVDEDSGRGVGLDAVKEMVTRLGGRVRIGTTQGEYCHFRVQLPVPAAPREVRVEEIAREAA